MNGEQVAWSVLTIALQALPAVAAELRKSVDAGAIEEPLRSKVEAILPPVGESGELAAKLEKLHLEE